MVYSINIVTIMKQTLYLTTVHSLTLSRIRDTNVNLHSFEL